MFVVRTSVLSYERADGERPDLPDIQNILINKG